MLSSGFATSESINKSFTDLSSVHAIRGIGKHNQAQALEEISKQFESMMVRMMLKSMRDANAAFAEGNLLSSHEGDTYQQMYDDQLALSLSSGSSMGLAEIMAKQLKHRFDNQQSPVASNPSSVEANDIEKAQINAVAVQAHVKPTKLDNPESVQFDGSVQSFVRQVHPMMVNAARRLGIEPDVLIAQSALETGWGAKISRAAGGDSSLNLFNIKADKRWAGDAVAVTTIEFEQGVAVKQQAAFRRYASLQDSVDDYVEFIHSGARYAPAVACADGESYIRHLSQAGYATDPQYADKVLRIISSDEFKKAMNHLNSEVATDNATNITTAL